MDIEQHSQIVAVSRNPRSRETHELAYFMHRTGASEADVRRAIEKVGSNRAKVERELQLART